MAQRRVRKEVHVGKGSRDGNPCDGESAPRSVLRKAVNPVAQGDSLLNLSREYRRSTPPAQQSVLALLEPFFVRRVFENPRGLRFPHCVALRLLSVLLPWRPL